MSRVFQNKPLKEIYKEEVKGKDDMTRSKSNTNFTSACIISRNKR